jgi:hypothetical protein
LTGVTVGYEMCGDDSVAEPLTAGPNLPFWCSRLATIPTKHAIRAMTKRVLVPQWGDEKACRAA